MTGAPETTPAEHFIISYGKSGGLGSFSASEPLTLDRGARVVIDSPRGREVGTVLCPASVRQARLLGAVASGSIVRPISVADQVNLEASHSLSQQLFDASRQLACERELPLEILDVDVFLERQAVVQFIGEDLPVLDAFAQCSATVFRSASASKTWPCRQSPPNPTAAASRIAAKPRAAAVARHAARAAVAPRADQQRRICGLTSAICASRWKRGNGETCYSWGNA